MVIIFVINLSHYFFSFLFPFNLIHYFFSILLCLFLLLLFRVTCTVLPYNDSLKEPIPMLRSGRSCLAFSRSEMFELGIAPKEKLSCLFNPVAIQE